MCALELDLHDHPALKTPSALQWTITNNEQAF